MNRPRRVLVITVLESFATIFLQRGVYFFTKERLGFTGTENLWLALYVGLAYVAGAMLSHRLSLRLAERTLLVLCAVTQLAVHSTLAILVSPVLLVICASLVSFLGGVKWPLVAEKTWKPPESIVNRSTEMMP